MTSVQQADRSKSAAYKEATASAGPSLKVLDELFAQLDDQEIRYCHWKSNEHLGPSLVGDTDVDILVDRKAIVALTRILGETNFKRFVVKPGRGYPGIEDYVGFDSATGTLTHLHVHYQLTLGEKFLKGHRLPWEELYLSTRIRDERYGIYVTDPHLELLVLVVRAVMKLRARDIALELLGKPYLGGGMLRELRWLADRTDRGRLQEVAAGLVGENAARLLPTMLAGRRPTVRQLQAFGRRAEPALSTYRLYGAADTIRQMTTREWRAIWWKVKNWYHGAPTKSTRTLPQGGLFVAVLGVDGAGKSTLTSALADWLSHEVAVTTTYGGSGKGSASLPRGLMQKVAAWRRRLRGATGSPPPAARDYTVPDRPPSLARIVWLLVLAGERRRRAAEARRAKALGMVVVSDRLPQSQFPGWNDGPRLQPWLQDGSAIRRYAARREASVFRLVDLVPPDLVIKLQISPQVASQRKPETPHQQILNGARMVRSLRFPPTTRILELDAEQPLADVLLQAKRAIWDSL
jgi:energy-coupling factor transporter ATP-binding protein EcfA2